MRQCPNCSQEIQDEAVYCRHCHTDLEPPLWLISMRKCPYCAEWVENDLERCRYCDKPLIVAGAQHAAPFVESDTTPEEITRSLRQNLLDEDSEEVAAIAAAAAEFIADDPDVPLAGFDTGELREGSFMDTLPDESEPSTEPDLRKSLYEEPLDNSSNVPLAGINTGDLRESAFSDQLPDEPDSSIQSDQSRSLYDEPLNDDIAEEASSISEPESDLRGSLYDESEESSYYYATDGSVEPNEPIDTASDSGIWMAGASEEDAKYAGGTGPLSADSDSLGRSMAGTEGVSELRAEVSGPPGRFRRVSGRVARIVVIVAVIGGAIWAFASFVQEPASAFLAEVLATDIPEDTETPPPTPTLRSAPTLPPVTDEAGNGSAGALPTELGTPSFEPDPETGCISWEAITVDEAGTEACVYGVIKRWWAGDDIPFIAIFSEEVGTFAIIDRTTRHPVGPGSCIMASGIVEVMGGVRPNIDARGTLEDCPEGIVEG